MLNILGFNIPLEKKIVYSLTKIIGFGKDTTKNLCVFFKISPLLSWNDLDKQKQNTITQYIERLNTIGKHTKLKQANNIEIFIKNGSFRGFRHKHKLPVRGQRTHSNAKTVKRLFFSNKKNKN